MASTETILLSNIKANLEDATNFSTLTGKLEGADILPVFFVPGRTTPWAVVVPGDLTVDHDELLCEHKFAVDVHLISRRYQTPTSDVELVGNSTATGILEIVHEIRKALDRPSPYGTRLPTGATYTSMTNCPMVKYLGHDAPEVVDDTELFVRKGGKGSGAFSLVVCIHFEYMFYDERL